MTSKKIIQSGLIFILVVLMLRFFFLPFRTGTQDGHPFIVRVRLAHDAQSLNIGSKDKCDVFDNETGKPLERRREIHYGTKVLPADSGIKIGDRVFDARDIRVLSSRKRGIDLNKTLYRGEIDIRRTEGGLDAVNRVALEDYLKGVLPREINRFWPSAALKAQAIASRSYAVYQALRRKDEDYDLTADTFSQVYGGWSGERLRTTRAVEATKGDVLEYGGKIFPAYFHSCCGGHTRDVARAWNEGLKPLRGVKCPWCRWTPYFRWQVRVPKDTILEALNDKGYHIRRVDDIKGGPRDDSRRLEYVRVRAGNKWFEIKTENFRSAVGKTVLKSANFHVKKYPFFYLFSGYGWGHGVGMCQWGVFGLAIRKWSAERILQYYYPGTKIVDMREVLGP